MTCKPINGPGFTMIVCTRGRRREAECQEPGCSRPHTRLCDYPVTRDGELRTCDRRICSGHAVHVGADRDYCQAHARRAEVAGG